MKVISPKVDLVKYDSETSLMEKVGRVSYKSEDKITETSSEDFLKRIYNAGHWAVFEFGTKFFTLPVGDCPAIISILTDVNKPESKGTRIVEKDGKYYITTNYRVIYQLGVRFEKEDIAIGDQLGEFLRYSTEPDPSVHKLRATSHWIASIAVSNQALRGRVFSPMQESQRYCNYTKDKFGNELTFIIPHWAYEKEFNRLSDEDKGIILNKIQEDPEKDWGTVMWNELVNRSTKCSRREKYWKSVEKEYFEEIKEEGMLPEEARDVLDKQVKTEFYMCGYLDDWFYQPPVNSKEKAGFFSLRTAMAAQGDIRDLAKDLKSQMENYYAGPNFLYQISKQ